MPDPIETAWVRAQRCVDALFVAMQLADGKLSDRDFDHFSNSLPLLRYDVSDLRHIMVARVGRPTRVGEFVFDSAHHAAFYTIRGLIDQVDCYCPRDTAVQLVDGAIRAGRISPETLDRIKERPVRPEVVMRVIGVRRRDLRAQLAKARAETRQELGRFTAVLRANDLTAGVWKERLMLERNAARDAAARREEPSTLNPVDPPLEPLGPLLDHPEKLVREMTQAYIELRDIGETWVTLTQLERKVGCGQKGISRYSRRYQEMGILEKAEPPGSGFRVVAPPAHQ